MQYRRHRLVKSFFRIRVWFAIVVLLSFMGFLLNIANIASFTRRRINCSTFKEIIFAFDNETGADRLIVPKIIHYIRFNKTEIPFHEYICLRAAYLHQKPETIYIHTDLPGPNHFSGKYWELVKKEPNLWTRTKIVKCELPFEIFGQQLSDGWRLFHGSDVARIRYIWR